MRTNCGITEWFKIERGVRQGYILSPYLFNIYTEDIMREVGEDGKTVNFNELNIHGHKIRDLRYTDDTVDIGEGFWHIFICAPCNRKFKRKIAIS